MSKSTETEPIFVVGMNGSGTTMLLRSLERHPNLYGFPIETRILPYFLKRIHKYGDLNDDKKFRELWDAVRRSWPFLAANDGVEVPLPSNWRSKKRNLGVVFNEVFQYFAARKKKNRWCEKTPMYATHIEELGRLFPEAKFIHIIRDGRDCAASFHRRWNYHPELTIYRWKNVVTEARKQGFLLGDRYFELLYEDLTVEPEQWLRKICEFVGEDFQKSMLHPQPPNRGPVIVANIVKNSQKWRDYFNSVKLRRIEAIAGKVLNELGYQTDNADGDHNPPQLLRQLLMFRDSILVGVKVFFRNMRNTKYSVPQRVHLILARLATAVAQRKITKY